MLKVAGFLFSEEPRNRMGGMSSLYPTKDTRTFIVRVGEVPEVMRYMNAVYIIWAGGYPRYVGQTWNLKKTTFLAHEKRHTQLTN